jgi:hypothetical protein
LESGCEAGRVERRRWAGSVRVRTSDHRRPRSQTWCASSGPGRLSDSHVGLGTLSDVDLTGFKQTYILATGYENPYSDNRERLEGDPSWDFRTIGCGHDVMLDEPQQLVDVLLWST